MEFVCLCEVLTAKVLNFTNFEFEHFRKVESSSYSGIGMARFFYWFRIMFGVVAVYFVLSESPDKQRALKDEQGKNEQANANVLSVPQLMQYGMRVFMANKRRVKYGQVKIPLAPIMLNKRPGVSTIRVRVSNVDRTEMIEVKALLSSAAQASSISERLAARLGLIRNGHIEVVGLGIRSAEAYLPSQSLDVQC